MLQISGRINNSSGNIFINRIFKAHFTLRIGNAKLPKLHQLHRIIRVHIEAIVVSQHLNCLIFILVILIHPEAGSIHRTRHFFRANRIILNKCAGQAENAAGLVFEIFIESIGMDSAHGTIVNPFLDHLVSCNKNLRITLFQHFKAERGVEIDPLKIFNRKAFVNNGAHTIIMNTASKSTAYRNRRANAILIALNIRVRQNNNGATTGMNTCRKCEADAITDCRKPRCKESTGCINLPTGKRFFVRLNRNNLYIKSFRFVVAKEIS